MSNTHSAHIIAPGFSAFIDGIPDKCQHDWSGDAVYFTESGKTIYWHTFRAWAGYTEAMRGQLIHEHQDDIGDPVSGSAVTCRKCKKIFSPPLYEI